MLGLGHTRGMIFGLGGHCAAAAPPAPTFGAISATKDGSVGQTYTIAQAWTGVQWHRQALAAPFGLTAIAGANALTYVAQAGDAGYRLVATGTYGGQAVAAKAYQVVYAAPILIEGFESASGWTLSGGGAISVDTTLKAQGSAAVVMTGRPTQGQVITKTGISMPDPTTWGGIAYYANYGTDYEAQTNGGHSVQLSNLGTGSGFVSVSNVTGPSGMNSSTYTATGGFWWGYDASEVAAYSGYGAELKDVRATGGSSPFAHRTTIDAFMVNAKGRPTLVLTYDDIRPGQFDYALPRHIARKLPATVYVPTSLVGQAGRLTLANLQAMAAAGWDIALDGTNDDTAVTTRANPAACVSELQAMQAWLVSNGLDGPGKFHLCYPNGTFHADGTSINKTAVTTNGTTTVSMADTSTIAVGMRAVGYNVPAGTRVQSITANVSVTLSAAVPAGTTAIKFFDDSGAFHGNKLPDALKAAGFLTGRTTMTAPRIPFLSRFGVADRGLVLPGSGFTGMSAAQMRTQVQLALTSGQTVMHYIHDITLAGGGINVSAADHLDFMDWIAARRDAGELEVLTVSQFWARDSGAGCPV